MSLPKQGNKDGKQKAVTVEDSVDDDNWFYIETLSNKDIYFKADTSLPGNPVINDMVDVANGYAILSMPTFAPDNEPRNRRWLRVGCSFRQFIAEQ